MVDTVCERTKTNGDVTSREAKTSPKTGRASRFQPVSTLLEHCESRSSEQAPSPKLGWNWFAKTA